RGRLAQADAALGDFLFGASGAERDRVAHADDRLLGRFQGVRRGAAHVRVRGAAISAAAEIRRRRYAGLLNFYDPAASALSISGLSTVSILSAVIGPTSL